MMLATQTVTKLEGNSFNGQIEIENVQFWSNENPNLYNLEVIILNDEVKLITTHYQLEYVKLRLQIINFI